MPLLALDLGTSSVKAALFTADGLELQAEASAAYNINHPQPGWAEQDPMAIWDATLIAVRQTLSGINPNEVAAISLDGQMHSVICADASGVPLLPAIIWADGRSHQEVADLAVWQQKSSARMPGLPATGFAAATMLWLARHRPDIPERTAHVLAIKDWVRLRLTDLVAADHSDASAMWLYDLNTQGWSGELLDLIGWRLEQLPPIKHAGEKAGELTKKAAAKTGLPAGIPVVVGAADLAAQALGHGIVAPGQTMVVVGTGGQVLTVLDQPPDETSTRPGTYLFAHAVPSVFYRQTAMLTAGASLRWLRDLLGYRDDPNGYAKLSSLAEAVPAGAGGLTFDPFLAGERAAGSRPPRFAAFNGLRLEHGPGHLARAIMEGVCRVLGEHLAHLPADQPLVLSGGITKSSIWCHIAADMWQRKLTLADPQVPYAARGGAILARMAANY